jgi:hypothetical protein
VLVYCCDSSYLFLDMVVFFNSSITLLFEIFLLTMIPSIFIVEGLSLTRVMRAKLSSCSSLDYASESSVSLLSDSCIACIVLTFLLFLYTLFVCLGLRSWLSLPFLFFRWENSLKYDRIMRHFVWQAKHTTFWFSSSHFLLYLHSKLSMSWNILDRRSASFENLWSSICTKWVDCELRVRCTRMIVSRECYYFLCMHALTGLL